MKCKEDFNILQIDSEIEKKKTMILQETNDFEIDKVSASVVVKKLVNCSSTSNKKLLNKV